MAQNNKRREASKRQLQQRLAERQQLDAARRRTRTIAAVSATAVALVLIIVLIAVVGGGSKKKTPAAAATTPTVAATTATVLPPGTCDWPSTGTASKKVQLPSTTVPTTGKVSVSVATTRGPLTFTLDRSLAPCTVANFVSLVKQGYYDKTPCHRLVTSGIYVLQCGDPTGTGSGGPGYSIKDEATGNEKYPAGTIAMARTQAAHSGGSQFFIVYKDSPNLVQGLGTLQYTVFGTVSKGLGVVTGVADGGATTGTDGPPKLAIKLTKLTVS